MPLHSKRSSAGSFLRFSVVVSTILSAGGSRTLAGDLFDVQPPGPLPMTNGLVNGADASGGPVGGKGLTAGQAMLWKYTARCALTPKQTLQAPDAETGKPLTFRGALGIAPEWHDGTCEADCQEKVSACLIALTNRTGKHVELSLTSAAPGMSKGLLPDANDLDYPHQEGAFFGSVFSGVAFACHGRDVTKAAQVKRFCALDPASCSGIATFTDAGACDDVCQMACTRLPDGSQRCAATACKDPMGHTWRFPITTHLRNRIEAGNADAMTNVGAEAEALTKWRSGATATYKSVDFGTPDRPITTFSAGWAAPRAGGRIEVWLDGTRRLGTLTLKNTRGAHQPQSTAVSASGISGLHDVVLKAFEVPPAGRLSTIELR